MTDLHIPATPVARGADYGLNLDDSVYNRLLKDRIIILGSEVNDQVANRICAQLLLLAAEDPERDIFLYINSPGGSISAGMAIYDTMQFVANDVATVGLGLAASMGQFLLCAGTKGKRYATPHARIMMHQPSGGIGGTAADIAIQALQMQESICPVTPIDDGVTNVVMEQLHNLESEDPDRDIWIYVKSPGCSLT